MRVDSGNGSDPPSLPRSPSALTHTMPVCITAVQSNDRFQGRLFPTRPFLRCDTRAFTIRYSGKYRMSPWIPVSAGCTNRCTPSPSSFSFVRLRPPNFLSYIFLTPQLSLLSPPLHPHIHPLRRFLSLSAARPARLPLFPLFSAGTLHSTYLQFVSAAAAPLMGAHPAQMAVRGRSFGQAQTSIPSSSSSKPE